MILSERGSGFVVWLKSQVGDIMVKKGKVKKIEKKKQLSEV